MKKICRLRTFLSRSEAGRGRTEEKKTRRTRFCPTEYSPLHVLRLPLSPSDESALLITMDIVLNIYDRWLFTPYVYPKQGWPEDSLLRQVISLTVLINTHAVILYFLLAGLSYMFLFDKRQMAHPLFLKVSHGVLADGCCTLSPIDSSYSRIRFGKRSKSLWRTYRS